MDAASKTGDVKNNLTKFLKLIRKMKLEADPHVEQLLQGSPQAYLPVLHQALVHYSLLLSQWLTEKGYKLQGRNDLRFVEAMYRSLRDVFSYKPDLTREQFLAKGFAERKMIMSARILELCQEKHKELSSRQSKNKKRQGQHTDLSSRPTKPQYRHPQRVEPEIFNVCASEGVSSVWEEPVEYRVDTPFSVTRRDQQALPFNLNGLTPPPTPRRGLPYLQYMGQITPTRRQHQMQTPQSTDLDITPVATPLKPSVRVEREEACERDLTSVQHPAARESSSSSDSSETESLVSAGQPQARAAGSVLPSSSQPPGHSLHQQDPQRATHSTATRLSADHLLLGACGAQSSSGLHNSLEQRIQELTSCIEKMSAKMVLLETQVQMNEQQGGKVHDRASQPVSTHESVSRIPVTASAEADQVRVTLSSVGSTCNDNIATMEGGRSGTEDVTKLVASGRAVTRSHVRADLSGELSRQWGEMETGMTPRLALTSKSPKDGLRGMHMDTQAHKETSVGMTTSDALITQLKRKTQETQMFLHSVMTSRPSLVR